MKQLPVEAFLIIVFGVILYGVGVVNVINKNEIVGELAKMLAVFIIVFVLLQPKKNNPW